MADERESHMRGEGGAPADRHAIRYYQKIWAEGGLMGKPERLNGAGFVMACPGRSSDVIHIYVWIEAGNIQEAHVRPLDAGCRRYPLPFGTGKPAE
jgi:hypothetical protein